MHADVSVFEPAPPDDRDSPMSFSMEGYPERPPSPLIARYHAPRWNSVQALNKFQEEVAGPLRGGDPGVRLIEPPAAPGAAAARLRRRRAFRPAGRRLLAVPLHHIYGSEELSMLSPPVAGRAPAPYLALGPRDAERLGARDGTDARGGAARSRRAASEPAGAHRGVAARRARRPAGRAARQPFLDLPAELEIDRGGGRV